MIRPLALTLASAALFGSAFAQQDPKPEAPRPPEPGHEERPPLPPSELRERPPRGPEGRENGQPPERPPGPPRDGERRPEGLAPRDGERQRGSEGRRFDGERRPDQPRSPEAGRSAEAPKKLTPFLGIATSTTPTALAAQLGLKEGFGLVVNEVLPDSPAHTAGVQRHDVLRLFNDQQLVDPTQLSALVRSLGKDAEVALTIIRQGQEQKLTVKIGEKLLPEWRPDELRGGTGAFEIHREYSFPSSRRNPDQGREPQEHLSDFQEKMRAFQQEMNKWQEKMREWGEKREGEMPKPPPFPMMENPRQRPNGAISPDQPVNPADILRDLRPGGPAQVRADWTDGASRWDASRARVTMRDREGEVELGVKDGHRTLTVKNPAGETVFTGAVDTPEQRDAVPEPFRGKLAALEMPPQHPPGPEGSRAGPRPEEGSQPQRQPREPNVQ